MRFSALAYYLFLGLLLAGGVAERASALRSIGTMPSRSSVSLARPLLYGRYIVRSNLDARREARLMMVSSLSNSIFQFLFLTFTDYRDALIYGDFSRW